MAKKDEETFENSLKQLQEIVTKLESGEVELDKAIEEFQKAITLAKICDGKLKNAKKAINKIVNEDNTINDFLIEE